MRIKALEVVNFKGLKAISIDDPDPTLVVLVGPNGAGKSSVLDAVAAAFAGAGASPDVPVRKGSPNASVVVETGEFTVRRRWTPDGRTTLAVEDASGGRVRSPQALLDAAFGAVAFDPLLFCRQDSRAQAAALRALAGLDGPLAALDRRAEDVRADRALANRRLRDLDGQLRTLPSPAAFVGVPAEESDAEDLITALTAAERAAGDQERARVAARRDQERHGQAAARLDDLRAEWERLRLRVQTAEREERATAEAMARSAAEYRQVCESPAPDAASVRDRLRAAQAENAKVREKRAVLDRHAERAAVADEVESAGAELASIAAEREALLSEASYPVDGLSVRGDEVLYRGVPLAQASASQKTLVGLRVGAALNPRLKVALVRDGSLLDADSMAVVEDFAACTGVQVWLERVGDRTAAEGVVIEDGRIWADRPRRPKAGPTPATDARPTPETAPGRPRPAADIHDETVRDAESLF